MEQIEFEISTGTSINNIRDLRNEMRDLRGQMATAEGQEFQKLSERASELNAQISRTNSLVTSSGSAFTNFNTMLGRTSKSLLTLDFGAAAEQAQALQNITKKMTFKELSSGLKSAASSFKMLGKAILANPLFLIGAVVIGLAVAIYKLMEELGILQNTIDAVASYLDFLLKPIKALIQALKDLSDWFGWTSHAADKLAEQEAKAAETRRVAHEIAQQAAEDDLSRSIQLMKETGAAIEDIEEAEIRLAEMRVDNFKEQMKREKAMFMVKKSLGILSDEEMKREAELNEQLKQLMHDVEMTRTKIDNARNKREQATEKEKRKRAQETANKIKEINDNTDEFLEDLKRKEKLIEIENIEDSIERNKQLQLQKLEWAKQDIDFTKMNAEAKTKWEQWEKDEIARINQEANDKAAELEEQKILKLEEQRNTFLNSIKEQRKLTEEEEAELQFELELERMRELLESKAITQEEFDNLELERKEVLSKKLLKIESDRLDNEDKLRKASKKAAIDSNLDLFNKIAEFSEQGSVIQKTAALTSILASQGEALAKSVPIALESAKGTGPGAPFVFAATLAGIAGTIAGTIGSAMSILKSAPGPSPSGGSGSSGSSPIVQTQGFQPSFSNFRDDLAGDISGGQSMGMSSTFITDRELANNDERANFLKNRKNF
jgi:hypothetical protein